MSENGDNDSPLGTGISSLNPTARSEEHLTPGCVSGPEPNPSKAGHIRFGHYLSQHKEDSHDRPSRVDS